MSESSEPMDVPPPTSVNPTPPGYAQGAAYPQGPGYEQGAGYAQGPGYAQQGPGYPPNPAYTPYQSYGYPYAYPPMPPMPLPNGMAITGMVLGIVGAVTALFYVGIVIGIVGLIFSIIALRAVGRREAGGRGMAVTGLVTSIVAIIIGAAEIVFLVWFVSGAVNCSQYDPGINSTQYNQCVRQSVLGG